MPKKCESCQFYCRLETTKGTFEYCGSADVFDVLFEDIFDDLLGGHQTQEDPVYLETARQICDREQDGHFVYFEPKTPAAGAAAEIPQSEIPNPQSADWRKDLNQIARAAKCKSPHVSKGDTPNPEKTKSATA